MTNNHIFHLACWPFLVLSLTLPPSVTPSFSLPLSFSSYLSLCSINSGRTSGTFSNSAENKASKMSTSLSFLSLSLLLSLYSSFVSSRSLVHYSNSSSYSFSHTTVLHFTHRQLSVSLPICCFFSFSSPYLIFFPLQDASNRLPALEQLGPVHVHFLSFSFCFQQQQQQHRHHHHQNNNNNNNITKKKKKSEQM